MTSSTMKANIEPVSIIMILSNVCSPKIPEKINYIENDILTEITQDKNERTNMT